MRISITIVFALLLSLTVALPQLSEIKTGARIAQRSTSSASDNPSTSTTTSLLYHTRPQVKQPFDDTTPVVTVRFTRTVTDTIPSEYTVHVTKTFTTTIWETADSVSTTTIQIQYGSSPSWGGVIFGNSSSTRIQYEGSSSSLASLLSEGSNTTQQDVISSPETVTSTSSCPSITSSDSTLRSTTNEVIMSTQSPAVVMSSSTSSSISTSSIPETAKTSPSIASHVQNNMGQTLSVNVGYPPVVTPFLPPA
ncbi:uncharacterized protein LY89DRAFT_783692 [Mollisia scopiformis]|uniref:Uncharacterized protein n=1 Tax=Mollisia scopiformis TaxID=149040 RepID=A0A194X5V7_MOLSC|nr:uncharacterized protein LY89DRAFT_783692 [Mollisia scopiformis]KUJ15563.1 hypothetical protein LY89DRAFT_783692 [Mollisia scopiformis]